MSNPTKDALADVRKYQEEHLSPLRKGLTTASMAPLIVHGSAADRYNHWLERIGEKEPEDLSNVFPVQWGKHNETFVLDWMEKTTQREITERQRFIRHPMLPGIGCTIDGYRPFDDAIVECKVLGPYSKSDDTPSEPGFKNYYSPQLAVQMSCRPAARGYLCIQQGNFAPQLFEVNVDETYTVQVLKLLTEFNDCVVTRTPPGPAPTPPVPAELWRAVDLDAVSNENWVPAMKPTLERWQQTRAIASEHEQTKKDVKTLLPDDVGRVTYGSIYIRRARNGAVTILEDKE